MALKKPRIFSFKKPLKPQNPKCRFLGFYYFFLKFYTYRMHFFVFIVLCVITYRKLCDTENGV